MDVTFYCWMFILKALHEHGMMLAGHVTLSSSLVHALVMNHVHRTGVNIMYLEENSSHTPANDSAVPN